MLFCACDTGLNFSNPGRLNDQEVEDERTISRLRRNCRDLYIKHGPHDAWVDYRIRSCSTENVIGHDASRAQRLCSAMRGIRVVA
jgi:hypothetical protein